MSEYLDEEYQRICEHLDVQYYATQNGGGCSCKDCGKVIYIDA